VRALAFVGAILLLAGAARAQARWTLAPALTVGAGYDDNLFLDPTLTSARPARADAVFDLHPTLLASLVAHGHAFVLDADYLERLTPSSGDLRDLLLRIGWSSPLWHRLRASLGGVYEHYGTSAYTDDTFDLGGAEASVRGLFATAWIQGGYRVAARGYPDPSRNGQLDLEQRASATGHVRLHRLAALDLGYSYWHVTSNEPTAALDRHRADLTATFLAARWLTLAAGYSFWGQTLPHGGESAVSTQPGGPRQDLAHAVTASVTARPRGWLELFARYDFILSTSDANSGRYRLDQIVAGVGVAWDFRHETLPAPPPLMPSVHHRAVTFRARARPGATVAVVGDWNGWRPLPLMPAGAGLFTATYELPSGRHRWALSIDGVVVTPPEASGWAEDDFGGRNALLDVP
jgi:hypothetical protein